MEELKVITRKVYFFVTSDGREFDDEQEAMDWQQAINHIKDITMLASNFKPTIEVDSAYYVHIKNMEQLDAFNEVQGYNGLDTILPEPGYYYYNEDIENYVNVQDEIERLQDIINKLDMHKS